MEPPVDKLCSGGIHEACCVAEDAKYIEYRRSDVNDFGNLSTVPV